MTTRLVDLKGKLVAGQYYCGGSIGWTGISSQERNSLVGNAVSIAGQIPLEHHLPATCDLLAAERIGIGTCLHLTIAHCSGNNPAPSLNYGLLSKSGFGVRKPFLFSDKNQITLSYADTIHPGHLSVSSQEHS